MILIHPTVVEMSHAHREMRHALRDGARLLPEVERLRNAYLKAHGQPNSASLFAAWEIAQNAANQNAERRAQAEARRDMADAAFDALPMSVRWAWLDTIGTA